jgi:hypothetical protein
MSCVSSTSVRARTHIKVSYRVFRRATGEVKTCAPADLVANMYNPHIRIQMKKKESKCAWCCVVSYHQIIRKHTGISPHFLCQLEQVYGHRQHAGLSGSH